MSQHLSGASPVEAARADPVPSAADPGDTAGLIDRRVDLALSIATLALGLFLIYSSYGIRRGSIPDPIGSGGWAFVLGVAITIVALALVTRRLAGWRNEASNLVPSDGAKEEEPSFPSSSIRPFLLLAVGAAWIYALPQIGFIAATYLMSAASIALMNVRSLTKLLLVPLLFSLIVWELFGQIFGIHFPGGPIEEALQGIISRLH
jgi:putative tricarboxylic transport membrane protein